MTNLEFTQQDIERLVDKLAAVTSTLTQQERMLLVAIFAAAANQTQPSDTPNAGLLPVPEFWGQERGTGARRGLQPTTEELKRQLLDGYVPGKDFGGSTHIDKKVVG